MRYRLSIHDLVPDTRFEASGDACRYIFVVDGRCIVADGAGTRTLEAGDGAVLAPDAAVRAGGQCWLCSAGTAPQASDGGPEGRLPVVRSRLVDLDDSAPPLFRVDRIDLEVRAQTPRHYHRGPGIRRLLFGRVTVAIGDDLLGVPPGGAWFEPGDEPVVGTNVAAGASAFLRLSLLPAELDGGKSSFIPASDADAARPRAVGQRLLHEEHLPA